MSEGRKRSRKSKLEVRDDDCDYEILSEENDKTTTATENLQKPSLKSCPYKKILGHQWLDHDYCIPGFQSLVYPLNPTYNNTNSIVGVQQASSSPEPSDKVHNEQITHNIKKNRSILRKSQNSSSKKMDYKLKIKNQVIKMCKYEPDNILSVSKELSSNSNNPIDRVLDIEMRNMWGNALQSREIVSAHESMLQMALNAWQVWYNGSKAVRECPLFYQCHICNLAWWRLQPFREHLPNHDVRKMKVSLKENVHECMLVCSYKAVTKMKFIHIDEECWKCGNDVAFHKNAARVYSCSRCKRTMYTCSAWSEHISVCIYSNISNFNIALERQCKVCHRFIDSLDKVEKHMILAHSVRSDHPVSIILKECVLCNSKYFTFSTHNCPRSPKNSSCDYCCRKFATKPLALSHMLSQYNRPKLCKFCAKPFEARCQEMEHLYQEHSNNYQLAYKCTICWDQNFLFLDEDSVRKHKIFCHQKKTDRRRCFYEMMLVPKICLDTGSVEVLLQSGAESTEKLIVAVTENDDDFSIQSTSNEAPQHRILASDVDVTVDEVDIKREPVEYDENGEVNYEVMLNNMFKQDEKKQNKITKSLIKKENIEEFDFANVKIKTEPVDDIDIVDNPVENVKIKSEPVDDSDQYLKYQKQDSMELNNEEDFPETLTVKVEPGLDMDDINPDDIIIKNEINNDDSEDDISSESIPFDKLLDLKRLKSDGVMDWAQEESLNPDEMSIEVLNPSGLFKKKKVYACHKCGYTSQYKHYQIHVVSKCSVSPGIDGSHQCTKCGLKFVMFRNYVLHFDTHGYEPMACPKCSLTFDTLVRLLSHVQKHIKNNFVLVHVLNKGGEENSRSKKQVKCQECQNLVLKRDMFIHWENHLELKGTPSKPSIPPVEKEEVPELTVDCERVTMNNKTLEPAALKLAIEHLQSTTTYNSEKECIICYRAFARRYDVKRHIVEHLLMDAHMNKIKHKSFRCQICFENFQHQEKYKFHMREHASMPIFKCELCDKTFSDSSNFAKHKKTHNVRVLICDMCSKKFHSRAALQKHIADHSKLVETRCAFCDATFPDKPSYKRHKYQVHTKHKFKCVLCDLSFTCLQHKWDHDWEVHKERKQKADCPICRKSFRKLQDVKFHVRAEHSADMYTVRQRQPQIRKRIFECPTCRQKFRRMKDFAAHARSEHRAEIRVLKQANRLYDIKLIPLKESD